MYPLDRVRFVVVTLAALLVAGLAAADPPEVINVQGRLSDANGDPAGGIVAVFSDMTELRRLDRVRTEFVANASHELKTPLTAIRGFAETVADASVPDADRAAFAKRIVGHSERMAAIVDDLLTLARLEDRSYTILSQRVALRPLAEQILEGFAQRIEAAGTVYTLAVEPPDLGVGMRQVVVVVVDRPVIGDARHEQFPAARPAAQIRRLDDPAAEHHVVLKQLAVHPNRRAPPGLALGDHAAVGEGIVLQDPIPAEHVATEVTGQLRLRHLPVAADGDHDGRPHAGGFAQLEHGIDHRRRRRAGVVDRENQRRLPAGQDIRQRFGLQRAPQGAADRPSNVGRRLHAFGGKLPDDPPLRDVQDQLSPAVADGILHGRSPWLSGAQGARGVSELPHCTAARARCPPP